jgi:hypothetical protein
MESGLVSASYAHSAYSYLPATTTMGEAHSNAGSSFGQSAEALSR